MVSQQKYHYLTKQTIPPENFNFDHSVRQTVQFPCEATVTMDTSYQWNYNEHGYSNTRTGIIIIVTFDRSVIR